MKQVGSLLVDSIRRLLLLAPGVDGRIAVVAAVVVYLTVIATGRLVWRVDLWPSLGVPSGPSLFFDARNLTAAWESERLGYDPLYESPRDPRGRPLTYPRVWLLLGGLGLDQSHTIVLACILIGALFLYFVLLIGRVPLGTGLVLAVAACSPAVMFAVERANMDVALFSVIAAALLAWRSWPSVARILSPALVLLAATAKLYPAFALPAFVITRDRIAARAALACLAAFALYVVSNMSDLTHIAAIATQGELFSYGARILPAHLYHQVGADRWAGPPLLKQMVAVVPLAVIVTALAGWIRARQAQQIDGVPGSTTALLALHIGTLIYLGTFAIGNSFDYRLVFLLLTLPQLAAWARTPEHHLSSLALSTLVAILVLLWVGSVSHALALWDEVASWVVAGLLAAIGVATVPRLAAIQDAIFGRTFRMLPSLGSKA
jgi:Glycosyltransferase family 87